MLKDANNAAMALVCLYCAFASSSAGTYIERTQQGERMFLRGEGLRAHVSGHTTILSPSQSACIHCHSLNRPMSVEARGAPALHGRALTDAMPRRGGPAMAYDVNSFCTTLATGIDPAHIVLKKEMPIFEVDKSRCQALWQYLISTQ